MVIGIYPRKSVYRDNSDSVQVQIQMCKDYANIIYKGQSLEFRIYDRDEGFSGKNTKRPSFQEMMADVRNGLLDVVMVYKLDRISRNVQEFSAMYEVFERHNVSFVSVKESFDTTTPMGRTVMYILAAFAQLERENTSERVADNMQALGIDGKWTGGTLPSGFTSVRRKFGEKEHSYLIVDTSTIGSVKQYYSLLLSGYSITKLERYCISHGIRSINGNYLNSSQLHNIITNPVYGQNSLEAYYYFNDKGCTVADKSLWDGTKGLIAYGRTKTGRDAQRSQEMSQWIIAVGIHDYVIPAEEWIAAQKRLYINTNVRTAKHESGILKGVLQCKCGSRIDVRTYKKNGITFSYYYCSAMVKYGKKQCNSNYIRVEKVEQAFMDKLRSIRLDPSGITLRDPDESIFDAKTISHKLKFVESSIQNLTNALTQAMDTAASGYIIQQISDLDKQRNSLSADLHRAELQELDRKSAEEAQKDVYDNICYLLDNFDTIDFRGKNEMIRKIVKRCILDTSTNEMEIVF